MLQNNKKLLIILAALVAVFLVIRFFKSEKNVRTFKAELFTLDTAAVSSFKVYPSADGKEEIVFQKTGDAWSVSKGTITSPIDKNQINAMLAQLLEVKPKRLAARSSDKWEQFQVDDSAGTRVVVTNSSGEEVVDIVVGKTTYRQVQPQGQQQMMRQQQPQIEGLSYLRNSGEEEVYASDGFLQMAFNRPFDSYRNKTLLDLNVGSLRSIRITNAEAATSFSKEGESWLQDGQPTDSATVASWISDLSLLSGQTFDDGFSPSGQPDYTATFSGDNMNDVTLNAWNQGAEFRVGSSENEGVYFVSDSSGVWGKVFGAI
ncbi:MAG: DUF4340 domain-containing protein [Bacteroidia bacterium]